MNFITRAIRNQQKLPTWLFWLPVQLLKFLLLFYRVKIVDPHDYISTKRGAVVLMWHNRLLFFAALFPKAARLRTRAVVSASRDGQYVVDIIHFFGMDGIRGSSSKKGANALRGALEAIREGYHVAFTPDGPRGPRYELKPGPVIVASMTGAEVIPMCINASSCWSCHSWDGFQIPKPFSTLTLILGESTTVPPNLDEEGIERERQRIQALQMALTRDPEA